MGQEEEGGEGGGGGKGEGDSYYSNKVMDDLGLIGTEFY